MSIELILLSVNLLFIFFSLYLDDISGQVFSLYILTIAAAESAIGLALIVIYYRLRGIISVDYISTIKG
jgi:NADH-quinone oxidoreductase subunit K